jgi:molecular chaperone DnaK (HSP70)
VAEPVGIDLGTTYSLAATVSEAGVRIHQTEMGQRSTPSVVFVGSSVTVVGEEAKHSAAVYPDRTFAFFKRDMGVPGTERTVDGRPWTPDQLSAEVLRSLLRDVQRDTGEPPTQAVITVPAYFGEGARRATVEAGRLAGLEVLELIHEPTAAALAFGFGGPGEAQARTILVYDLGGGTFDVSLVRLGPEEMAVLATDGDHELGGKDWDDVVIEIVADRFQERHGVDARWDPVAAADLRARCEDAKRSLSKVPSTNVLVVCDGANDRIPVSRDELDALSAGLLAQTETLVNSVLSEAGFRWDQIDAAVLVGGSTRMPACAALVERLSGRAPTRGIDPDIAVAQGAALVAARHRSEAGVPGARRGLRAFSGGRRGGPETPDTGRAANGLVRSVTVKDVTAHALGFVVINAAGDRYVNDVMIARNTALPAWQTKTKRLEKGIDELDVYVLQGHQERPLATESLGRYRFADVPGGKKDRDLDISFSYDSDGMVQVSARSEAKPSHHRCTTPTTEICRGPTRTHVITPAACSMWRSSWTAPAACRASVSPRRRRRAWTSPV